MAPVSTNDPVVDSSLLTFAQFYARGEPVGRLGLRLAAPAACECCMCQQ
jgi:hypothetical protein